MSKSLLPVSLIPPFNFQRSVLASALALSLGLAQAQSANPASAAVPLQQAAQPLDRALTALAASTGILVGVDANLLRGKQAAALNGSYTPEQALAALLAGTGLEAGKTGDRSYTVRPASAPAEPAAGAATKGLAVLPAVTVTASATADSAPGLRAKVGGGALGTRTQLETPLSTTVVTRDELEQRQISKLGDVFALDASVTDNSGAYSSWASYVTVRGLDLDWQNAYRIDGKPFLSYAITLPYEHFEQIELLKGSSGFLYGFGSPGGLINYVTKQPTDEPLRSVELGYKSNSIWSQSVDLGGRFGDDKKFGYRLNAVNENGKTFNDGTIDRQSVSLALDARLTPDLTWNFDSLYQKRKTEGQGPSISAAQLVGSSLPGTVLGDSQNLLSGGQFLDTEFLFTSTGLKYRISPDWTASTNYSYSTSKRSRNESILYLQDAAGNYNENRSDTREGHRFDQWQAMLEGRAVAGGLEHQLVVGAAWQKQLNDYSANGAWITLSPGNIFTPDSSSYTSQGNLNLYRAGDITQKALFASDTVKLSERWSVLGGLRNTRYAQNDYNVDGSLQSNYSDSVTTPTVALMFRPAANTMVYTSYMQSLEPGKTVGSTYANANRLLDPLTSKQYELGVKSEQQRWSATAALFRIERPSEYANSSNVLLQDGESRYQGLELGASTRVGSQWQLSGNLMLLDTAYNKGNANIGNRVAGAPEWMATARVRYQVPQVTGLELSADAKFTGNVMLNVANSVQVGAHSVYNLGASYSLNLGGYATTLRAGINNLTNARFWEYQYANWIKPADPRSLSLSARFDF
ncbi:TonB-dependent siderophore receptor [Rhodoferax sp.]|uniref:TonB-dependent siderophore receptor n=1 Tax=Rhodoferax sp. TaxID=50421 RepID=UPI00374DEBA8